MTSMLIWQYRIDGKHFIISLLLILVSVQTVKSQCGRSLRFLTAVPDSDEFSSPGYPVSYSSFLSCSWRIYAQNDSHAIRVDITDSDIEYDPFCSFDYGQVFDGDNSLYSASMGKFCGTQKPSFVSTNSTITVRFVTDSSKSAPGFQARYYSGLRSDLIDGMDTEPGSVDLAVALGSTFGCLSFIVLLSVIFILAYKFKQAETKSQARQRPRFPRPLSSIQVQPYNDNDHVLINRQMPPAYEAIQGSSHRQPPGYIPGNNDEYADTSGLSNQNDPYPTKYNDENISVKKKPPGDNADLVSNAHIITSSSKRRLSTNLGYAGANDSFAGTSGASQELNPAALKTGKHGAIKNGIEAGPLPSKRMI